MNVFIVFVKFLDWIVAIWLRLAKLIKEKGGLRFWKEDPTIKMKYLITKKTKKIKLDPGGPKPPPESVPIFNLCM